MLLRTRKKRTRDMPPPIPSTDPMRGSRRRILAGPRAARAAPGEHTQPFFPFSPFLKKQYPQAPRGKVPPCLPGPSPVSGSSPPPGTPALWHPSSARGVPRPPGLPVLQPWRLPSGAHPPQSGNRVHVLYFSRLNSLQLSMPRPIINHNVVKQPPRAANPHQKKQRPQW